LTLSHAVPRSPMEIPVPSHPPIGVGHGTLTGQGKSKIEKCQHVNHWPEAKDRAKIKPCPACPTAPDHSGSDPHWPGPFSCPQSAPGARLVAPQAPAVPGRHCPQERATERRVHSRRAAMPTQAGGARHDERMQHRRMRHARARPWPVPRLLRT
jgi:hypothetical protein